MRQAVAAFVAAQALASHQETMSRTPALPEAPMLATRRRRAWVKALWPSAWKPTHARGKLLGVTEPDPTT